MDIVRALVRDHATAELSTADRAMLDYAVKLTRTPGQVQRDDTDRLRREGFSDAAILDVCQVVAYYNYVNRLADGLGVELEDFWTEEDLTVTRDELETTEGKEQS
jgi:uncharacterized peroxidase-related enzyme